MEPLSFNRADNISFDNMPGRCLVAEPSSGRLHFSYHAEYFAELLPDEV